MYHFVHRLRALSLEVCYLHYCTKVDHNEARLHERAVIKLLHVAMQKQIVIPLLIIVYLPASHAIEQSNPGWTAQCVARVNGALEGRGSNSHSINFVGPDRMTHPNLTIPEAHGISYYDCTVLCSDITSFAFGNFSSQTTQWLLPWLGLIGS